MEDPNRSDELLKRYAKERREQGGSFELHPATRRLLQAEVARQFRARDPKKGGLPSWLGLWRGRLLLGGAVTAALVLAVWMFGPQNKPEATIQLAKNDVLSGKSHLAERENLSSGDSTAPATAVLPKLQTLAQRNVPLEPARPKELAAVTVSESLIPEQDRQADVRLKDLTVRDANAPEQQSANLYSLAPSGAGPTARRRETNASDALALNNSGKLFYESREPEGFASTLGRTDGSSPLQTRYAGASTSGFVVNQNSSPSLTTKLGLQPQVAYKIEEETRALEAGEPSPRIEVSQMLTPRRELADSTLPRTVEKPVALPREATALAATAPSPGAVPQTQADALGVEQKSLSPGRADSAAAVAGELPGRGEVMLFFRQSPQGLQEEVRENLSRNPQRDGVVRSQLDFAADKSDAPPEVLSQFTVELDGNTIRVTDVDHSVYEGAISNEVVLTELDASQEALDDKVRARRTALPKATAPASPARQDYSFRAVGSNATMKQMVIVNGRMSGADGLARRVNRPAAMGGAAPASAAATAPARNRFSAAGTTAAFGTTFIPTNATLTIEGTVRVGATNEQRFRAVRSPR